MYTGLKFTEGQIAVLWGTSMLKISKQDIAGYVWAKGVLDHSLNAAGVEGDRFEPLTFTMFIQCLVSIGWVYSEPMNQFVSPSGACHAWKNILLNTWHPKWHSTCKDEDFANFTKELAQLAEIIEVLNNPNSFVEP